MKKYFLIIFILLNLTISPIFCLTEFQFKLLFKAMLDPEVKSFGRLRVLYGLNILKMNNSSIEDTCKNICSFLDKDQDYFVEIEEITEVVSMFSKIHQIIDEIEESKKDSDKKDDIKAVEQCQRTKKLIPSVKKLFNSFKTKCPLNSDDIEREFRKAIGFVERKRIANGLEFNLTPQTQQMVQASNYKAKNKLYYNKFNIDMPQQITKAYFIIGAPSFRETEKIEIEFNGHIYEPMIGHPECKLDENNSINGLFGNYMEFDISLDPTHFKKQNNEISINSWEDRNGEIYNPGITILRSRLEFERISNFITFKMPVLPDIETESNVFSQYSNSQISGLESGPQIIQKQIPYKFKVKKSILNNQFESQLLDYENYIKMVNKTFLFLKPFSEVKYKWIFGVPNEDDIYSFEKVYDAKEGSIIATPSFSEFPNTA